ncbi:hypothetical protein ASPCAL11629 [Aspergillus calidoustus]|uniref:Uncharacterized protein n=1 Tax=Aspergillus calidoustus TaxID=454130 RepID=A0A0U5GF72_ASPCI|nr:hypothetical protein ASPCAL11629 [Aspergillus calidoustus]
MTPKACDHCYQNKEKCAFAPEAEACLRCQHLGIVCFMSRENKRKGRRPVLKSFGHGSLQIWEPGRDREADVGNAKLRASALDRRSGRVGIGLINTPLPAKQGQSSKNTALSGFPEEVLQHRIIPHTALDAIGILTDDDEFTTVHIPFVMGGSFVQDLRAAIHSVLYHSGPVVIDGYLAFLSLVAHCQASRLPWTTPDLRRAATALHNLRNVEIMLPQDALCVLLLGQALFVFEVLADSSTTSAHSIIQGALISAKPWYPLLSRVPAFDTVTFCPVLMDIVGCLVHRKVPIIRMCVQDRIVVDRYAGLCSTLLPLLYHLCVRSHAAEAGAVTVDGGSTDQEKPEDCYTDIERSIEFWAPDIPPDFFTAYDEVEIQMMTTQANAYRLAALLVIHRLRFPFGVQDTLGQYYANCIFHEISSFFAYSNTHGAGAFPVTFPLFISMIEVEGPGEDLLGNLQRFPIQSICMLKLHGFVRHVRRVKESGDNVSLFDLVEHDLTYAVLP